MLLLYGYGLGRTLGIAANREYLPASPAHDNELDARREAARQWRMRASRDVFAFTHSGGGGLMGTPCSASAPSGSSCSPSGGKPSIFAPLPAGPSSGCG